MNMMTKKELAVLYQIHPNTLSKQLKEIGIDKRSRLTPKDIAKVYTELGEPEHEPAKEIRGKGYSN